MEVKKIHHSKLHPAPYNPRVDLQPGDPEYEALKISLQDYGYVDPIVWNKRTGNVVGGHQRLKVLVEQGYEEPEVVVVDMDEEKERSLGLALNKIAGRWDEQKLSDVLSGLLETGIDLVATGFDPQEIALLTVPDSLFTTADDLTLSADYKEPVKKQLKCPKCSHVDTADRFAKQ